MAATWTRKFNKGGTDKTKRFTETAKWDDPWFIRLTMREKLLWMYICDRCDASGVIDFSPKLASVQIGAKVTDQFLKDFGNRVHQLASGKWQIVKFLPFQYGTVDNKCPAHKPVIRLIQANGLEYPISNLTNTLPGRVLNTLSEIPNRVFNTLKEKEKDKDKDKDKDKEGESEGKPNLVPSAEDIYQAYPRHEAKPDALAAIEKAIKKRFGRAFLLERTTAYAKTQPPRSRFTPLPATWFNAERFNDDPAEWVREDQAQSAQPKAGRDPYEITGKSRYYGRQND